jgi:hypothetical protein
VVEEEKEQDEGWRRRLTLLRFTCPDSAAKRAKPLQNQRFRPRTRGRGTGPSRTRVSNCWKCQDQEIAAW